LIGTNDWVDNRVVMGRFVTADAAPTTGGLLERDDQLAALSQSLQAVQQSSRGSVVLVSGEAGVGKTSLLRTFAEAYGRGARVLWGACDPLFTPQPLGPLLVLAEESGGELAEVVGNGAMPHEVVSALVRDLPGRTPTVFVLEDVHWSDEATLDVLRLLSRRVQTIPVLLIASYRDDELDRTHPLRIVVGELATSQAVARLKLDGLSPAAVARLAEPLGIDAGELYRRTAGNPFFVVEVLAARADEIPATVRDAVFARAARLSLPARRLLEAVAVVPAHAELWLLEALAGETTDGLDECLGSGMLTSATGSVSFRHELARLAFEESVEPNRKLELHRRALAALADPPDGVRDLARLAHHAEAAGDVDAVLRFAPAAGARASELGAHREAAAQYARALRFADRLPVAERADLLERRSHECMLTDQYDDGIAALEEALEFRRALGDKLKEGDALRRLSDFLWCPGRTAESERAARDAVTLLERLPESRELGRAYARLAGSYACAMRSDEALAAAQPGLELAERLGDPWLAAHTRSIIGGCLDYAILEQSQEDARRAGLDEEFGRIFIPLAGIAVERRQHAVATKHLEAGIAYCSRRGFELYRLYLLAYRARVELDQGRWAEAADTALSVLRVPRTSTTPRIHALVVLALIRARRGDPEVWPLLDDAWALAEPTRELPRLGPVAAARAEAAWLEGNSELVGIATDGALALALERNAPWLIGELAVWRRRAGLVAAVDGKAAEPYDCELRGDAVRAGRFWDELGCPYDSALALAEADQEPQSLSRALTELQRLEARAAAVVVARRLRERGVRGLPRGPRAATRRNPGHLTPRESEVLGLVTKGMRNGEIADRLVLSERTVDHHVAAILRKLEVRTRAEASVKAVRLGLAGQDR
jgi:DNA-binding CsgD family transcriptional regulator/tetratricopeptide (TPR) repeat protein